MSGKDEYKVFVGGLAWDITERQLENAFDRFGKIVSCQNVGSAASVVQVLEVSGSHMIVGRFKLAFTFSTVAHEIQFDPENGHVSEFIRLIMGGESLFFILCSTGLVYLIDDFCKGYEEDFKMAVKLSLFSSNSTFHTHFLKPSAAVLYCFGEQNHAVTERVKAGRASKNLVAFKSLWGTSATDDWFESELLALVTAEASVLIVDRQLIEWDSIDDSTEVVARAGNGNIRKAHREMNNIGSLELWLLHKMPVPVLQVLPSMRTVGHLVNWKCNSIENILLTIMLERDTGRPRGFGFITFVDRRAMDDAIEQMHGREFGDRVITVNEAQPRMSDDLDHGYRGGYPSGGRGGHRGGERSVGRDDCFKCGRPGHWARDCPSAGGRSGTGGSFSSRSRFGGTDVRGDRFGERDRFIDDRYDGGRFGDQDRFDTRETRYGSRDRYQPPTGDRFASDRYGASDRYLQNGYGKDRGYDRDGGPRGIGGDRYGSGGPARNDRSYRSRPDPYARPPIGGRPSSFDRY